MRLVDATKGRLGEVVGIRGSVRMERRTWWGAVIGLTAVLFCLLWSLTENGRTSSAWASQSKRDGVVDRMPPTLRRRNRRSIPCWSTAASEDKVADERGFVCVTDEVQKSGTRRGCCSPSTSSRMFSCDTCNPTTHCCMVYEYCVVCCMRPSHEEVRQVTLEKKPSLATYRGFLFNRSAFEVCERICKTDASSLVHENAYRSAAHHCFGMGPPPSEPNNQPELFRFIAKAGRVIVNRLSKREQS